MIYIVATVAILLAFILPLRFLPTLLVALVFHTGRIDLVAPFTLVKIVSLVIVIRAALNVRFFNFRFCREDFFIFVLGSALLSTALFKTEPFASLQSRIGTSLEILPAYFAFRILFTSREIAETFVRHLVVILVVFAALLCFEHITRKNLYYNLGGWTESPEIRNGRARSQGPFKHSILAGTVVAIIAPLVLLNARKTFQRIGVFSGLAAVLACASSSPVVAAMVAAAHVGFWRFRKAMRLCIALTVLGLFIGHLIKERPIWFIIDRIDFTGGSTGWYRAQLFDQAINHFDEWWFAGTEYTRHWMPTGPANTPDHADMVNLYVALGVQSGVWAPFSLLLIITSLCWRMYRPPFVDNESEKRAWILLSSVVAASFAVFSVAFFDHSQVIFYGVIGACVSAATTRRYPSENRRIIA